MTDHSWDDIPMASDLEESTEPETEASLPENSAVEVYQEPEVLKVSEFLELQKEKARQNLVLSENDNEDSIVLRAVIIDLDRIKHGVDQTILAALWEMHRDASYVYINGSQSLEEAIENMRGSLRNFDYTMRLARGISTILEYVYQKQISDEGPIIADDGTKITVEHFIEGNGFVSKISQFWADFEKADEDTKEVLVGKIGTESRSKISAFLDSGTKVNIPKIKYKVEEKGDKRKIIMENLTEAQYQLFMKIAKPVLDETF